MRIVGGSAKGRKIKCPKGGKVRPLMESVREALFNILGKKVTDACFLDLFAGTGAVGIEALSRSAKFVVFVENDWRVVEVLRENLVSLGFLDSAEIWGLDVLRALKVLARRNAKFDIIFSGAPYASKLSEQILDMLGENIILKSTGYLVVEHQKKKRLGDHYKALELVDKRTYGETVLAFYQLGK